jgi:hypothetical protein
MNLERTQRQTLALARPGAVHQAFAQQTASRRSQQCNANLRLSSSKEGKTEKLTY